MNKQWKAVKTHILCCMCFLTNLCPNVNRLHWALRILLAVDVLWLVKSLRTQLSFSPDSLEFRVSLLFSQQKSPSSSAGSSVFSSTSLSSSLRSSFSSWRQKEAGFLWGYVQIHFFFHLFIFFNLHVALILFRIFVIGINNMQKMSLRAAKCWCWLSPFPRRI